MSFTREKPENEKSSLASQPTSTVSTPKPLSVNSQSPSETKDVAEQQSTNNDDDDYPTSVRLFFVVVALVLSIFLIALDLTIIATAIPKITDEFHGLADVGWYGSAFFLTFASFQSGWGKAYRYFPLKTTFLVSVGIFELGSLICGVARSSTTLIIGRAIAGLGGAGVASGAYTIIAFAARPQHRPAFTGILGASYGVASVVGPLLGGAFTDNLSWRWCFYINLPIGGVGAFIVLLFFRTPARAVPTKAPLREKIIQMDPLGTVTIMGAVVCYILALQWGGLSKSWGSPDVIGTLVGFVLLVILFMVIEWRLGERAMVVGRLFKNRIISIGMVFATLLGGTFFTVLYYLPVYFQTVANVSPAQSGVRNLPLVISITIATISSGILITVLGHFVPFMTAGAALATIGAGLLFTLNTTTPSSEWIGYQIVAGVGIGLAVQVPVISAQATSEPSDISSATAMILFAQSIGGAFLVSGAQSAFANTLVRNLATNAPNVSPAKVLATGATQIRDMFPPEAVPGIVNSYMAGLNVVFAIAITSAGLATIVTVFNKWQNLNGSKAVSAA